MPRKLPIDATDSTEPTEPTDRIEPTDPTDRIEPTELTDSREPVELIDHRDVPSEHSDSEDPRGAAPAVAAARSRPGRVDDVPAATGVGQALPGGLAAGTGRGARGTGAIRCR